MERLPLTELLNVLGDISDIKNPDAKKETKEFGTGKKSNLSQEEKHALMIKKMQEARGQSG